MTEHFSELGYLVLGGGGGGVKRHRSLPTPGEVDCVAETEGVEGVVGLVDDDMIKLETTNYFKNQKMKTILFMVE